MNPKKQENEAVKVEKEKAEEQNREKSSNKEICSLIK